MKQLFSFLSLFFALFAVAQKKDTLDVRKDMPLISMAYPGGPPLKNLNGDSVHGDAGLLQAITSYNSNFRGNRQLNLLFPKGVYRIDTTVVSNHNVHFIFAKGSRVISTYKLTYGTNVFETIGASGVQFWYMKYTNHRSGYINAVVQFKAQPNVCTGLKLIGCRFENIWASSGWMGGFIGNGDSSFWLDRPELINDTVINNFNPSHPHMLSENEYHTDNDCSGLDLVNAYKKLRLTGCYIVNTSGANIEGLGMSKEFSHDPQSGSAEIWNNDCRFGNMNCEINGTYVGHNLNIHNNRFSYPSQAGGFNISCQGKPLIVKDNYCLSADNGNLELSFYGGECSGNKCYMFPWRSASMGWKHGPYHVGSSRIGGLHIYGFFANVHDNLFSVDTVGKSSSSPNEWMGVVLLSPASNLDSTYERNSFATLSRIAGGHRIHHNTFIGQTNRIVDNSTRSLSQKVVFEYNTIRTANLLPGDAVIWIKGFNNTYAHNTFDFRGSAPPANRNTGIFLKLGRGFGEIIKDNSVIGGAARVANNPDYKFIQR